VLSDVPTFWSLLMMRSGENERRATCNVVESTKQKVEAHLCHLRSIKWNHSRKADRIQTETKSGVAVATLVFRALRMT